MRRPNRPRQRGNTILEASFALLPLLFLLLGSMELLRGMWMYHSVSAAVKSGVRFTVVHGQNCIDLMPGCAATVGDIATRIRQAGVGVDASQLQLTFTSDAGVYTCQTLLDCAADTTVWPPAGANNAGARITIQGTYAFQSGMSILWGNTALPLTGKSTEMVQF
jgi:hypothetical protein